MTTILLGAAAFALALAFDWASWRRLAYWKPILGLAAAITLAGALVLALFDPAHFDCPAWAAFLGWPLALVGAFLLAYSLFVEIPFTATYAEQGVGDRLITSGTYALVRHPGVLWFGLLMAGLALLSRGRLMLFAGAVWFLLDALYVWLQEVLLFCKMFPGYAAYQRQTPMLVPTPQSVARCLHTWRRPGCQSSAAGPGRTSPQPGNALRFKPRAGPGPGTGPEGR